MQTESITRTSEITGIPKTTIHHWTTLPWWAERLEQFRIETNAETKHQLLSIVRAGYDNVLDRLENGDHRPVGKEIARVPMTGKDSAVVASIALDKLRVAEGLPTRITATTDALSKAASAFDKLASQYRDKVVSEQ